MSEITPLMKVAHGNTPFMVPAEVRDRIDQAELLDRLVYVEDLLKMAERTPSLAERCTQEARAVLAAPPRDEAGEAVFKARGRARMFEANGMPEHAAPAAQHAYELSGRYRRAPERDWSLRYGSRPRDAAARAELRKGARIVYDLGGHLVGVARPDDITPVGSGLGCPVFNESGEQFGNVELARITRV